MFTGEYQKLGPELLLEGFRLNALDSLIDFEQINKAPRIDVGTCRAHTARPGSDPAVAVCAYAIERLGENARQCRLADPAGAGKQVSVMNSP